MASNQEAGYKAGETKGRAEEKTGNMIDVTKEKAFEVKDRAFDAAQAAKERAQEGTGKTGSFLGEKTEAAKQKASETTPSTKESGEAGKEKTGGNILQQAGEQVKNVAFGAKDAVVNTLGMGDNKSNDKGECNDKGEKN